MSKGGVGRGREGGRKQGEGEGEGERERESKGINSTTDGPLERRGGEGKAGILVWHEVSWYRLRKMLYFLQDTYLQNIASKTSASYERTDNAFFFFNKTVLKRQHNFSLVET